MKQVTIALLGLMTWQTATAQWLRPEPLQGALWGGLIGGIIGSDQCYGFSSDGAAIGAGVGLIAGALVGESRRRNSYDDTPDYAYSSGPQVSFGYGYGSHGSSAYMYYAPNRYCAPGYYYRPTRPNYVVSGTVLGAASGALIGAADDNVGTGAAIGAAAGLLVGSVAERAARKSEQRMADPETTTDPSQPQTTYVPSQLLPTEITSTPVANSTYHWTPRPQIADAPRVPDAPTF
jgi:uncharacterized protein YcfJ